MDATQITVPGPARYGEVCVVHGGILHLGAVTVGTLFVDGTAMISADGADGGTSATTDCAPRGTETPDAAAGGRIAITARSAIIAGTISANGGAGINAGDNCDNSGGGNGGAGGTITLDTGTLVLTGTIQARGGAGGYDSEAAHSGGPGGSISILAGRPLEPAVRAHLRVTPGKDTDLRVRAKAGTITAGILTVAMIATLPTAPGPLTLVVGEAPASRPVQSYARLIRDMACGAGDLNVQAGATIRLRGVRVYPHACVEGTITVQGRLTLVAQTVLVGAHGAIRADGAGGAVSTSATCAPAHGAPHAGSSGADGVGGANTGGVASTGGRGGAGGGVVTVVARRVVVAGTVSADGGVGGVGGDGLAGSPTSGDVPPATGGDGGNGGGLTIVAGDLQITGALAAAGGHGGRDGSPEYDAPSGFYGKRGLPGCVRLFASTMRAEAGHLAVHGPLLVGRPLPTDPVPPSSAPGMRYSTITLHTLSAPYRLFWQAHGGRATFGEPLSEPFRDGPEDVQFFERARLVGSGTRVSISPLGRLLTVGRGFKPAAPIVSTTARLYFSGTRHTLSGRFLLFWKQHRGNSIIGPPISEPLREVTEDGTGREYVVQYFANARLEYHPEIGDPGFQVQFGRLGYEYLHHRNLL